MAQVFAAPHRARLPLAVLALVIALGIALAWEVHRRVDHAPAKPSAPASRHAGPAAPHHPAG